MTSFPQAIQISSNFYGNDILVKKKYHLDEYLVDNRKAQIMFCIDLLLDIITLEFVHLINEFFDLFYSGNGRARSWA